MENATERMTVNNAKLERDPVKTVILASMMGTAIEFFDFYAYGTASAAYFPKVFFPQMTPVLATLLSLLTFGVSKHRGWWRVAALPLPLRSRDRPRR